MEIKIFLNRLLCWALLLLISTSCVSRKKMTYFQENGLEQTTRKQNNNLKIKPDDVLTIRVSAPEQEAALPFNLTKTVGSQVGMMGGVELETYLVTDKGTIEFPVIGTVEVEGLTNIELAEKIKGLIMEYVQDPIVNVRILNFQISVLGEVNNPGNFSIADDHVSLSKALAMAGDLTIFGKRKNIKLLREGPEGQKEYVTLDITKANIVNSPYYYLQQNDVIYVEPKGTKRQGASSVPIISTYLSIASLLASIVLIVNN